MASDERVRLLICAQCRSIEELPAFDGPQEHDDTGNYRLSQHQFTSGAYHPTTVGDVAKAEWDKPTFRVAITREITAAISGSDAGLGQEFYDVKNNYQQDAVECWKRHNRTTDCDDFRSDKMRLYADTRDARRAEGLPTDADHRPNTFLCNFCPVQSVKMQLMRKDRGDYNRKSWEPS